MKLLLQILLLFLTWFTNLLNATPVSTKVVLSNYEFTFSKTVNVKEERIVKIGVNNFARSGIAEKTHPLNATSRENYVLEENRARVRSVRVVNGAGSWLNALKSNAIFTSYFDGLTNGTITRKFANILSIEEEAVLKFYTTNPGYKDFNRALRGEIPMTDFYSAQKNLMEQALAKMPNSTFNSPQSLLYRIENLTEVQISSIYVEGSVINTKAFTSATYSESAVIDAIRNRTHTVLIRIEGKNGKLIEDLSTLPAEKELLFKTGTNFKVDKVGFSPNPDDYITPIKTIWLKEL